MKTLIYEPGHENFEMVQFSHIADRRILMFGEIDEETSTSVVNQLLYLESIDPGKEIILEINSPGGCVISTLAMIDTMNSITSDVRTIARGGAASGAALILASGTKGKRMAGKNTEIMIHEMSTGSRGKVSEMEREAKWNNKLNTRLAEILADATGQKLAKVKKDLKIDFFMFADEALKYGIIDHIL